MKEKEIIKGMTKPASKFKKIFGIFCLVSLIAIFIWTVEEAVYDKNWYCDRCQEYCSWMEDCYSEWACIECENTVVELWVEHLISYLDFIYLLIPVVIYAFAMLFVKYVWEVMEINVTDKRVYGKTTFGKGVDLPLDSISSIGKIKLFKGIKVATSSGRISFCFIANNEEVYEAISKLLVNRQDVTNSLKNNDERDYIKELKELKELLDADVITQEEFDSKKKELLNK